MNKNLSSMDAYIIKSNTTLPEICTDLNACGGFAAAKIIYNKTPTGRNETNNTLVICKPTTYENMLKTKDYQKRMKPYNWKSFYSPNLHKRETWDLHITGLPKTYSQDQAITFIRNRISKIVPSHVRDDDNNVTIDAYSINFDSTSRETGKIYGFGTITFDERIEEHEIKLCKLALHNSSFYEETNSEQRFLSCIWHITKTVPVAASNVTSISDIHEVAKPRGRNLPSVGGNNRGRGKKNFSRKIYREQPAVQTVTVNTSSVNSSSSTSVVSDTEKTKMLPTLNSVTLETSLPVISVLASIPVAIETTTTTQK